MDVERISLAIDTGLRREVMAWRGTGRDLRRLATQVLSGGTR